jgi:hypothetical protein
LTAQTTFESAQDLSSGFSVFRSQDNFIDIFLILVRTAGFGFARARHTPDTVRDIIETFRDSVPEDVYIVAGVPTHWRTASHDASENPKFIDLWLNDVDAIMPWTVGRYRNSDMANDYSATVMEQDIALLRERDESGDYPTVEYIPVVLPGASVKKKLLWHSSFNLVLNTPHSHAGA